jgi:hypothetical protein
MVQRLNTEQTRQILHDLVPSGFTQLRIPDPVTEEAVAGFCAPLADTSVGRSYGLFDGGTLKPLGFFMGLIMPDPLTGDMVGFEHIWWAAPKVNGLPLLRQFEADCQEAGCRRVICGYSDFVDPEKMSRLYRRLGYTKFSTAVTKEL